MLSKLYFVNVLLIKVKDPPLWMILLFFEFYDEHIPNNACKIDPKFSKIQQLMAIHEKFGKTATSGTYLKAL